MTSSPSFWNVALSINGAMFARSHASAVASEQSCASLQRLGTTFEKSGSVPFARSVANCVNGTSRRCCAGSFTTSDSSAKTLCFRA